MPEALPTPRDILSHAPFRRPAVAVSGGVDSLRALLECVEAGLSPIAVHALFHHAPEDEIELVDGLAGCCDTLGVPLYLFDLREDFADAVIRPFARDYREGRTPNPCARCNRAMKFGLLMDAGLAFGADGFLTGHYAALSFDGVGEGEPPLLCRAADSAKDQSYFLSLVPRERLARVRFPLAGCDKAGTIRTVREAGLVVPAKEESQEICFIEPGPEHYRHFLEEEWRRQGLSLPQPGPIVLRAPSGEDRVVGRHEGLWRYTEGQRQGIGVPWTEALYVTGKEAATNTLLVGTKAQARLRGVVAGEVVVHLAGGQLPVRALVRLRYRQAPAPATLTPDGEKLRVELDEPGTLTAPGQIAAIYDEKGRVIAGGIIESLLR